MRQILQLCQINQLQEERIDNGPTIDGEQTKDGPQQNHNNVIGKVQIINNGKEDEGQSAPHGEDCKCPQPGKHFSFVFVFKTIEIILISPHK